MSDEEVDFRRRENWIRDPADYPDFPSRQVMSSYKWSPAASAHMDNWYRFFAGLREKPPEKSGLFRPTRPDGSLYFGPAEDQ